MLVSYQEFTESKSPHCVITLHFAKLQDEKARQIIEGLGFEEGPVTSDIRRKKVAVQIQGTTVIVVVHYECTNEREHFDANGIIHILPKDMESVCCALKTALSVLEPVTHVLRVPTEVR